MEGIKNWVVNIAGVAVLMIILDLLMPEGRIRKFTQLLTGFVLMFVIINPVLGLFGKGVPASFAGWEDETFLWNRQVKITAGCMEDEQREQTLELYRRMLVADIKNRLESHEQIDKAEVDCVINENMESEKFGEIRRLYISLSFQQKKNISPEQQAGIINEISRELQQVFLLKENEITIQLSGEE
jgi:stage III sporulation protein AF